MTRTSNLYLQDIIKEINKIELSTQQLKFEQFESYYEKHYTVIRALEIIGEAANKVSDNIQQQNSQIEWHKIIGLRNVIAHEYFDLDLKIIWDNSKKYT